MAEEEFIEGVDFVKCELCGECMRHLSNHIQKFHKISVKKYLELFPDSKVISEQTQAKRAEANRQKYANEVHHHYKKRKVYLMPDGTYAFRTDVYKRAWGVDEVKEEHIIDASTVEYVPSYAKEVFTGVEDVDYVTCAICGEKKVNLARHIREKHGLTPEEYTEKYNRPTMCSRVKETFHNGSLKKWQTQLANGTYVPKPKREASLEPHVVVTAEMINEGYANGLLVGELAKSLGISYTTLTKYQKEYGIETPPAALIRIRKGVKAGASVDLEHSSLDEIEKMKDEYGLEGLCLKAGISRDVLTSWMRRLKDERDIDAFESLFK